jgi:hypothetical protein
MIHKEFIVKQQSYALCKFSKQKANCLNTHITFPLRVRVSVQKKFQNEFSWKGLYDHESLINEIHSLTWLLISEVNEKSSSTLVNIVEATIIK